MPGTGPIWIFAPYDSPPGDGWRALRSECLARALRKRGHEVVLWMANFSYHTKTYRAEAWQEQEVEPGFVVRFVPARGYQKNLDWRRLRFEVDFAKAIQRRGKEEPSPSAIITREPPQVLGHVALKLGRHHGCPVVSDVFDLWPEFFHQVLPGPAKRLGRLLFWPLYAWRRNNWRRSDAVVALAGSYLEVPFREAPAVRNKPHAVVYNGIDVDDFRQRMARPSALVEELIATKQSREVWAIYAGTLGNSYDIEAMVEAARQVASRNPEFVLWVAGAGPLQGLVEKAAKEVSAIRFLGKLSIEDLLPLYRHCDIGLCAYSKASNVEMPDKIYDYTAAGLPVVNSLRGEVGELIRETRLGMNYQAGDAVDLASKLEVLTTDPEIRRGCADRSYEVAAQYSAPVQFDRYVDLIEGLR